MNVDQVYSCAGCNRSCGTPFAFNLCFFLVFIINEVTLVPKTCSDPGRMACKTGPCLPPVPLSSFMFPSGVSTVIITSLILLSSCPCLHLDPTKTELRLNTRGGFLRRLRGIEQCLLVKARMADNPNHSLCAISYILINPRGGRALGRDAHARAFLAAASIVALEIVETELAAPAILSFHIFLLRK